MWHPQRYIERGKKEGREDDLLLNASNQIGDVKNGYHEFPGILSLNHLSKRSGVDYFLLRQIVTRSSDRFYKKFSIRKKSGGRRFIHVPFPGLSKVQKWIHQHILTHKRPHESSFAFSRGGSIVKCAAKHSGARWLIKMDIKGFFESISEIQVYRVFKSIGYQPLVTFELARICTVPVSAEFSPRRGDSVWRVNKYNKKIPSYSAKIMGYLPQGAPTSPMLSNLVMVDVDHRITNIANKFGLTYTRYSDDFTFSTRSNQFDRIKASDLVKQIGVLLHANGFRPQHRKTLVVPPGSRKIVLGLQVDGAVPTLRREFKDNLRQHLYYLEKFGPHDHSERRKFESMWGMKRHIKGLIDFSKMVDHSYAEKMLLKFNSIEWPI